MLIILLEILHFWTSKVHYEVAANKVQNFDDGGFFPFFVWSFVRWSFIRTPGWRGPKNYLVPRVLLIFMAGM